jgi:cytochrome c5
VQRLPRDGVAGAPKYGDKVAWAAQQSGSRRLVASAIKGKRAMPRRAPATATDADIRAAVEYMLAAAK